MCCLNALANQIQTIPDYVRLKASDIVDKPTKFIINLSRFVKSTDDCDTGLRCVLESWTLVDLLRHTEKVSRPILKTINSIRSTFSAVRIFRSVQYVVSGSLYRDFAQERVVPFVTGVSFLAARSLATLHWCVDMKFFTFESLAQKAASVGGAPAFGAVNVLKSSRVLDSLFWVALTGLIVEDVKKIQSGDLSLSTLLSVASLCTDVAAISLGIVGMGNPIMLTAMGVVASGLGVASYFAPSAVK